MTDMFACSSVEDNNEHTHTKLKENKLVTTVEPLIGNLSYFFVTNLLGMNPGRHEEWNFHCLPSSKQASFQCLI